MKNTNEQKIFLVINLSYFGDVLVTNALCQNIKLNYPDSKIVFVVNKPFYEAAKYQYCVDEVLCLDKRGSNSGFLGLLKFALSCPYRGKIFASFICYDNDRGILLSCLLGAKRRIAGRNSNFKFLLTDVCYFKENYKQMKDSTANMISVLTDRPPEILPIKYLTNPAEEELTQKLLHQYKDKEIVGLCTVGKHTENYMPVETAVELINRINEDGKIVFYFGAGDDTKNYAEELKKYGCTNFVDLTNKTTIYQLANVMKICKAIITIDTGTMHLAYATGCPTVCMFYRPFMVEPWGPCSKLYPNTIIVDSNYTAQNIYDTAKKLLQKDLQPA